MAAEIYLTIWDRNATQQERQLKNWSLSPAKGLSPPSEAPLRALPLPTHHNLLLSPAHLSAPPTVVMGKKTVLTQSFSPNALRLSKSIAKI